MFVFGQIRNVFTFFVGCLRARCVGGGGCRSSVGSFCAVGARRTCCIVAVVVGGGGGRRHFRSQFKNIFVEIYSK